MSSSVLEAATCVISARQRLHAAREDLQRVGEAMQGEAQPDQQATAQAVEAARQRMQDAQAAHALGEAEESAVGAAGAALKRAERDHELCVIAASGFDSRTQGLTRRFDAARAEEGAAKQAVTEAELQWLRVQHLEVEKAYAQHAAELNRLTARGQSLGQAIRARGANPGNAMDLALNLALPTIGGHTAGIVSERTARRDHGMRAMLYDHWSVARAVDPEAIERELLGAAPAA